MEQQPILVATDLGDAASRVIEAGLGIARSLDAPPILLHVDAHRYLFGETLGEIASHDLAEMQSAYRERSAATVREILETLGLGATDVEVLFREGRAYEAILAEAQRRNALAIVVGSHVRRGLERLLLGRTALRVVREARCGVFTVDVRPNKRPEPWRPFQRIVLATDLREESGAGHWAARLAGRLGAHLTVLHVAEFSVSLAAPYVIPPRTHETMLSLLERRLDALRERLAHISAEQAPGAAGVDRRLLEASDAATGIVEAASSEGADLVVLGTHGRRGLARALLGSVAEGVLHHAATTVLTVRDED